MTSGAFHFDRFRLDPADRMLRRDQAPVELNARYLDALALLVREQGKLISKDRFLEEVWQDVPVTDEALTQCIKTLRKQLGDDAGTVIARRRLLVGRPEEDMKFVNVISLRSDGFQFCPGGGPSGAIRPMGTTRGLSPPQRGSMPSTCPVVALKYAFGSASTSASMPLKPGPTTLPNSSG